jgi:hypothetical protein
VEVTTSCDFDEPNKTSDDTALPADTPWHGEDGEYLLWWLKGARLPPLLTRGRRGFAPVLGQPNTTLLLGGSLLDQEEQSGGRFTLAESLWQVDEHTKLGLEGTYFFLGTRTASLSVGGSGAPDAPVLGRPFVDAATGMERVLLITAPGRPPGDVLVSYSSRMQGAEMNAVGTFYSANLFQFDGLLGFRYLEVDEGLNLTERQLLPAVLPGVEPTTVGLADQFDGHNRFYGGQVGARLDFRGGGFFANVLGKVALGETYEVVRIGGLTVVTPPATLAHTTPGGLLALPTNSGRFVREAFAVVPEFTLKVGYNMGDHARFFLGYDFLYLSDLARPADQIDRVLNPAQVPILNPAGGPLTGAARPQASIQHTDFWAHGLSIGMEFRY